MIDRQLDAKEKPWVELVEWWRENCRKRGLTLDPISAYEVEIKRRGMRVLLIRFDLSAHIQLTYELEDGTPKELQVVMTSEDQAYFRRNEFTYFRTSDLGARMLDELLSLGRVLGQSGD